MSQLTLVFVHGYSVTNLDTYGELPQRLRNEGIARGIDVKTEDIYLGRYISFNDEVRLSDVSAAMEAAVRQQIPAGGRFVCITHSTGGPVVRNWFDLFYKNASAECPMSHLIMLAPANHGSALAQLGKTRLSRVKSWFDGVEPGQKILDWLELGSAESWKLNVAWIKEGAGQVSGKGIYPFVLTGQDIDRKLYDHINSYTGELGSDGVVRVASANLNSTYIRLKQVKPTLVKSALQASELREDGFYEAPVTAMRVLRHKSHSGETMGIMRSVLKDTSDANSKEIVETVFKCVAVNSVDAYKQLCAAFTQETAAVQKETRVETEKRLLKETTYIHDRYSMIVFRIMDSEGYPVTNFDLILTGPGDDPDMLPAGFFVDRQANRNNSFIITYYFNYDSMKGSEAVIRDGKEIRAALPGIDSLGLMIQPRPDEGFIRYLPCRINASRDLLDKALKANATTLIDIVLTRVVSNEVFRFEKAEPDGITDRSFKNTKPGRSILD